VLNLEEPALFNEMVERFIALVEAGCWGGARSAVDLGGGKAVIPGDARFFLRGAIASSRRRADGGQAAERLVSRSENMSH
jgi:hypothetical protein